MPTNIDEVRELMAEGDRLLGRAWEQTRSSKPGLSGADLELADHYYAQAAQAYLVGAAEYQHGRAVTRDGRAMEDVGELVESLDGRLRTEAESALRTAAESRPIASRNDAAGRGRVLAEELRDRFAHAVPELFHRGSDLDVRRTEDAARSR